MPETFEYDVFISHSSADKPTVRELANLLRKDGVKVWLDEWVIQPGDSISLEVERGLESSRVLVLAMSEAAFASEWVSLERHTAVFRDPTNQQRRFIPILLSDCEIRDSLKPFAYVDWRGRGAGEYRKLLNAVRKSTPQPKRQVSLEEQHVHFATAKPVDALAVADKGNRIATITGKAAQVWDTESKSCIATLDGHFDTPLDVKLVPGAQIAVTCAKDGDVRLWDIDTASCMSVLRERDTSSATCISVARSGTVLAAGAYDSIIRVWSLETNDCVARLHGHQRSILGVVISDDGRTVVSNSRDGTIRVWDVATQECMATYANLFDRFNNNALLQKIAVVPDMSKAIVGLSNGTVRVWDLLTGGGVSVLEGHTSSVKSVLSIGGGTQAASASSDGTVRIWDLEHGECVKLMRIPGGTPQLLDADASGNRLFYANSNRVASFSLRGNPQATFAGTSHKVKSMTQYTNAKVLVVGDSGVGKSGLSIKLTKDRFEPTVSSDAHWATQVKLPKSGLAEGVDKEIWLWDFAGQADYRLIHQLFMDETALAVLVFNPQDDNPFDGLSQWDRDLSRAARRRFAKLLVAGRCDRGGLRVGRDSVAEFVRANDFAAYVETSALTGAGCDQLRQEIEKRIDWNAIPWTASPAIFRMLKEEILSLRDGGVVLLRMSELKQQLEMRLVERSANSGDLQSEDIAFTLDELRAVVGLLAGPGIVSKLEFGDVVMLQPEWINKYASAVIRSVRAHAGEIGVVDEASVLAGDLDYTLDVSQSQSKDESGLDRMHMQRLEQSDEAIVLRAMHQMFVDHGLCVRQDIEGGGRQLIFPSYFKHELPRNPGHPPVLVDYCFDGNADEIYATLVVQLWQTKAFENGELWRYAADFKSASGARLGLKMGRQEGGAPVISVYFDSDVQDDTKVTFIKYVHEHLLQKASSVVRLRAFVCNSCSHPVRDTQLAREILNADEKDARIRCQRCDTSFPLWDAIEQKFASPNFSQRVRDLEEKARAAIDNESRELILEGHARVIAGEAGQIYRGYTGSDHGIDAEIEFKDEVGSASGERVYLQLKSGDSYLHERKSDGAEVFRIKSSRWASYWQQHAYPVMLVIRTSDEQIRWMNVSEYLAQHASRDGKPARQIVFDGVPFTALSVQRLRDRVLAIRRQ